MRPLVTALLLALVAAAALAAACAPEDAPPADLAVRLDCLRANGLAVVAAHRGQPDPSAPENAISSFAASHAAGVPFLEIDIATTRDRVLVLMHDDSLDRTTTGRGEVSERTWAEVRALKLERPDGAVMDEGVPRLADALRWGREVGARFELDVKKATRFSNVVDVVRAERMTDRVLVVTYSLADAKAVHDLDSRLMISVSVDRREDLNAARRLIDARRLLGWTGNQAPRSRLFATLRDAGIEPIFGTLGRPGERLDDVYAADGNLSEYVDLVRAGVVIIASDRAVAAQSAIGDGYRRCLP